LPHGIAICCQIFTLPVLKRESFNLNFPKLPLLPGKYRLLAVIGSKQKEQFFPQSHISIFFSMVFDKQDHGTVYLEHSWKGRI